MSLNLVENIRHHGFKRLLLAVSGGLDSICLAHYFIENSAALGIEWLGIAHVHHGLREGTADRDAKFVEEFAKSHDVPFFLKKLDGEALKNADGSLEENARDARYKTLMEIASISATKNCMDPRLRENDNEEREDDIKNAFGSALDDSTNGDSGTEAGMTNSNEIIVTAHHAGDQAETMYMRLRRGTTLAGLRGIQEVREMPDQVEHDNSANIHLYRPFLNVTRAELLEYAREHNLTWCEDESNSDVKFARNKIRHDLLPQLEKEILGATAQLCRIAGIADKAYAKVMRECDMLFSVALEQSTISDERKEIPAFAGMTVANGSVTGSCSYEPNSTKRLKSQVSYITASPFRMTIAKGNPGTESEMTSFIALDKKKLNKILQAHKDADLSELFRLWLSEKGFRFPIGFFYGPKEPAHVKIPVRAVYRRRSIVKIAHTVWICEFKDALSATKFVSCEKKEKDYNEPT